MEKNLDNANKLISEKNFKEAAEMLSQMGEDVEVLKLLGLCHLNLGDFTGAVKDFETVVKYAQDDATSWYHLALCYDNLDDYSKAKFAYRKVIELRDKYVDAYKNLGVIYLKTREIEKAYELGKTASELFPDEYLFYYLAGSALLSLREFEKSLEYFEKATQLNNINVQLYCNYGTALMSCHKLKEALEVYQKGLEINPDHATLYYNIASVYQIQRKNKEAVEYFRKAYELEDAELFLSALALAEFKTGDVEKAIEYYKTLVNNHPEKQNYKYNLACCYEKIGDYETSIEYLEQLILMQPRSLIMLQKLAKLLISSNQFSRAKLIYETIIAGGFVSDDIYYNYAMVCTKTGDLDIAERIFKKVIELNPKHARARKDLGVIYLNKRLFDYADDEFKKAYEISPNDSEIVFEYANYLQAMQKWEDAQPLYEKAIELDSKVANYYVFASLNAQNMKDLKSAVKYIEKAVKLLPADPFILLNAGRIYYSAKKYEKAQFVLIKSWEMNQNIEVENLIGLTYLGLKEYDKALDVFLKLTKDYPENMNILFSYAQAAEKTGRIEEAKAAVTRVLEIFDDMPGAKRMLKRIQKLEKQAK